MLPPRLGCYLKDSMLFLKAQRIFINFELECDLSCNSEREAGLEEAIWSCGETSGEATITSDGIQPVLVQY